MVSKNMTDYSLSSVTECGIVQTLNDREWQCCRRAYCKQRVEKSRVNSNERWDVQIVANLQYTATATVILCSS